ncbi:hypothetical protein B0T17DRAFT_508778 [Bombardia bombarda]|uniref:Uncharacterized protein n=1 Tax=Bombardia bombarda TaxID=252184 RepID=A0AA40C1Y3_9PEZI|nr:hypothetical protein B0T17DRAFT_508778 [Bombardia bombarda]
MIARRRDQIKLNVRKDCGWGLNSNDRLRGSRAGVGIRDVENERVTWKPGGLRWEPGYSVSVRYYLGVLVGLGWWMEAQRACNRDGKRRRPWSEEEGRPGAAPGAAPSAMRAIRMVMRAMSCACRRRVGECLASNPSTIEVMDGLRAEQRLFDLVQSPCRALLQPSEEMRQQTQATEGARVRRVRVRGGCEACLPARTAGYQYVLYHLLGRWLAESHLRVFTSFQTRAAILPLTLGRCLEALGPGADITSPTQYSHHARHAFLFTTYRVSLLHMKNPNPTSVPKI